MVRTGGTYWQVRPLDLAKAIAQRGFHDGDPPLPGNRGPWRLRVSEGTGEVTLAADAAVSMDVRAFGPLYARFTNVA